MQQFNINDWYTVQEATDKLNQNRRKKAPVKIDYVRSLARYGLIRIHKIGNASLYWKQDVDAYIVEGRGEKSGRAQHAKKVAKKGDVKPAA